MRSDRSRFLTLVLSFFVAMATILLSQEGSAAAFVRLVKADGIIDPVQAELIEKAIKQASEEKAEALIIQLDTPGGLDLSMRDIVKAMLSSETPVVVYVAPSGARAASAGVFIAYAAGIAVMAPGTNIGSAHPVMMGAPDSQKADPAMMKKVENDSAAYIRALAAKKKRNADWAEKAVRESVNITAEEALKLGVIDFTAISLDELLKKLDGKTVEALAGAKTLNTKNAEVKELEPGIRYRVLKVISNPNVAYVLMMIGLVGLYFELSNPGLILPGVVGAISLVLAFYSFQTLPINYAGLLLIALAVIFFIAEIKVVSYGLLTLAGIISLVLGSIMLFDTNLPFLKLSLWVLAPTVVIVSTALVLTMYYAVKIHRKSPVSGVEGLIQKEGVAADDISAGQGKVFIEGEYWNAVSKEPIQKGDKVRVTEVDGMVLKVSKS